MENLADAPMRAALAAAGAAAGAAATTASGTAGAGAARAPPLGCCDEMCTEFMRIPSKATHAAAAIRGATAAYRAAELAPWRVPLGAQIMGSDPQLMAAAARRLVLDLGAPRVDLNCGCPANTVTGNGAGSTLLKTPERVRALVAALVEAVEGAAPVTVKMRSGFGDTALFEDNLLAAQAGGAAFVTVHPRTKTQAYAGAADWSLVARARRVLSIPVVGNGDVVDAAAALRLVDATDCDGVMIGRGAIADPLIFARVRAAFAARRRERRRQERQRRRDAAAIVLNGGGGGGAIGGSNGFERQLDGDEEEEEEEEEDAWAAAWQEGSVDEAAIVCDFLERFLTTGPDGAPGGALAYVSNAQAWGRSKCMEDWRPHCLRACLCLVCIACRPLTLPPPSPSQPLSLSPSSSPLRRARHQHKTQHRASRRASGAARRCSSTSCQASPSCARPAARCCGRAPTRRPPRTCSRARRALCGATGAPAGRLTRCSSTTWR